MRLSETDLGPVFYKYKSLNNLEHILDMVLRDRLYGAKLSELNDPMEGTIIADESVPPEKFDEWGGIIEEIRIASFTDKDNDELMWAHYADGGRGCVIKFTLHELVPCEAVSYEDAPSWDGSPIDDEKLMQLLRYKLHPWKYESEYRVIFGHETYVPIRVQSIVFGPKIDNQRMNLLEHIIRLCRPDIELSQKYLGSSVNPLTDTYKGKLIVSVGPRDFDGCKACFDRNLDIKGISYYHQTERNFAIHKRESEKNNGN